MKRLILLHIVCCCFLVGKADYEMNTDSLIQVFQNLPHDSTRLVALNNIIRIEQNNPKCIQFSDTLMKEALFQKDDKYAGLAAYYHLLYYYNHNKNRQRSEMDYTNGTTRPQIRYMGLFLRRQTFPDRLVHLQRRIRACH